MNRNILSLVRQWMTKQRLDYLILPSNNEFMYPEVSTDAQPTKIQLICGFTGSNGILLISQANTSLLTDGRYLLQAHQQTICDTIIDMAKQNLVEYLLALSGSQNLNIGILTTLHTYQGVKNMMQALAADKQQKTLHFINNNELESVINCDMEYRKNDEKPFDVNDYAGKNTAEKIDLILSHMDPTSDGMIISDPASLCWLLNIRAKDDAFTPLLYGYGFLLRRNKICTIAKTSDKLVSMIKKQPNDQMRLQVDSHNINFHLMQQIAQSGHHVIEAPNPILLHKSIKDQKEVSGMRASHKRDGAAVVNLLYWLDQQISNDIPISEMDISQQIYSCRKTQDKFLSESFGSIVGFGANGAIIHYQPNLKDASAVRSPGILLIDSGGQYYDGTTDITRTIAIGPLADLSIKRDFTLVLKGHIALAKAIFPQGTTGAQLDCLARQFLWQDGKDYSHGTGHGVGYCSCVHEGPINISPRSIRSVVMANMVISNEPGYYLKDKYGIRIENLMLVKPVDDTKFLQFETLTMVPIDRNMILIELLDHTEIHWLNLYHETVYRHIASLVEEDVRLWLRNATEPL